MPLLALHYHLPTSYQARQRIDMDAPRRTRGAQQNYKDKSPQTSPVEVSTTYRKRIERDSTTPSSTDRATNTYSKNPLLRNSQFVGVRTGVPAPTVLTIPESVTDTEISCSFTNKSNRKSPDPASLQQTIKDKFIQGVLSTQLGQAISDNLAPYIPRTALAGFPEDDQFHSRNSYIDATMTLWERMRAKAENNDSAVDLGPTIQPDEMPIWTLDDVVAPRLSTDKEDTNPEPRPFKVLQPHPTILRPGLKAPVQQIEYRPRVPPKDKVDYRTPIHQPLKAETYHKQQTMHKPAPVQANSYSDKGPDDEWQTTSFGDIKYWSGHSHKDGVLLKAAPAIDLTDVIGLEADKKASSKSSNRSHRQQQIYGSYSKDDVDTLKCGSHTSLTKPGQAQTYPMCSSSKVPGPAARTSKSRDIQKIHKQTATAVQRPRSINKNRLVEGSMSLVDECAASSKQPPGCKDTTKLLSQQPKPTAGYLLGLEPPPEKKSRTKLTGEQRRMTAVMLNGSISPPSYTRTQNTPSPINFKYSGRRPPVSQSFLNPKAKTFRQDSPVENSRDFDQSNTTAPTQAPSSDGYQPLQRHSNHHNYAPGLNPTARTFHQDQYY